MGTGGEVVKHWVIGCLHQSNDYLANSFSGDVTILECFSFVSKSIHPTWMLISFGTSATYLEEDNHRGIEKAPFELSWMLRMMNLEPI
jgi:hypothetical protein